MQWKPFKGNKRGSSSVFLTAILCSMVLILGVFLEASSGKVVESYGKGVLDLASDSLLTEYNRTLKRDYGLFAFYGDKETLEEKMKGYAIKSFHKKEKKDRLDLLRVNLKNISVDTGEYKLVDLTIFQNEIGEFMKYRLTGIALEKAKNAFEEEEQIMKEGDDISKKTYNELEKTEQQYSETNETTESNEEEKELEKQIEAGKLKVKNLKKTAENLAENSINGKETGKEASEIVLRNQAIIAYLPSVNFQKNQHFNGDATKMILVHEYILDRMKNHLTQTSERERFFCNEVEYILAGKLNDHENFQSVKRQMMTMRTGLNMAHIYTDKVKLTQTGEMAALLTPGPLAPVTQLLLIASWSLAEAANDITLLVQGDKVPVVKNREEWALDLESLLSGSAHTNLENVGKTGVDYKGYLRLLLATVGAEKKLLRTMDIIQINMKANEDKSFLLREYCVGLRYMAELEKKSGFFGVMGNGIRNGEISGNNRY